MGFMDELKRLAHPYEDEDEDEYEDEDADPAPPQNPRTLIAIVLLVTASVLLFLAYLLAKREGLI